MTTYVDFNPSSSAVFQFQATLDNANYNITVPWNYYGQRYYVTVTTLQGVLIVNIPLIGSPPDYSINILGGYFTTTLVYRVADNRFEIG
jgi:hypothetical protein